ncbi:hypothetical protein JHD50_09880 [Sulfurimonas sp. MAG313]|nr:hypothetical protein [Sulfurimonas sp. MAG313]MDF1881608.1 hypothetical protein [Sulfurimonas sp. MAG313]
MKLFVLLFTLVICSFSLEIEAGKNYTGSVLLQSSAQGLSFTLAQGWTARLNEASSLTASKDNGQIIAIISTYDLTSDTVIQEMNQVQDMGDGVFLHPLAKARKISPLIYMADYKLSGAPSPMQSRVYVVLGPKDKALAFVGASQLHQLKIMQNDMYAMAKSAKFTKLKTPKQNDNPWYSKLKGQLLLRFYHGSGYSEKSKWWLCSDGHFETSFNASSATSLGTGAALSSNIGRWTVQGEQLVLDFQNGSQYIYELSMYDGYIYMDNDKVYRDTNNYCN